MVEELLTMIKNIKTNSIRTNLRSRYSIKILMVRLKNIVGICKKTFMEFRKNKKNERIRELLRKIYRSANRNYLIIRDEVVCCIKYNNRLKDILYIITVYDNLLLRYKI